MRDGGRCGRRRGRPGGGLMVRGGDRHALCFIQYVCFLTVYFSFSLLVQGPRPPSGDHGPRHWVTWDGCSGRGRCRTNQSSLQQYLSALRRRSSARHLVSSRGRKRVRTRKMGAPSYAQPGTVFQLSLFSYGTVIIKINFQTSLQLELFKKSFLQVYLKSSLLA